MIERGKLWTKRVTERRTDENRKETKRKERCRQRQIESQLAGINK